MICWERTNTPQYMKYKHGRLVFCSFAVCNWMRQWIGLKTVCVRGWFLQLFSCSSLGLGQPTVGSLCLCSYHLPPLIWKGCFILTKVNSSRIIRRKCCPHLIFKNPSWHLIHSDSLPAELGHITWSNEPRLHLNLENKIIFSVQFVYIIPTVKADLTWLSIKTNLNIFQ